MPIRLEQISTPKPAVLPSRRKNGANEQRRAVQLIRAAERLSPTLLKFTVPLYQVDEKSRPVLVGSGVLVALAEIRFLLTAGHVFDLNATGQLIVGVSPELFTIAGRPSRWRSIGAVKPSDDKIDIAAIRVEGGPWDALPMDRFLNWQSIDTAIPIAARQSYALIGFPHSVNRKAIHGERIKSAAFRFAGLECEPAAYTDEEVDANQNVMLGFEKNAMWGVEGRRNAPDLYGASGCGLWRFGRRIRGSFRPPKLSAIATEWHPKGKHRHILGTRITFIIGALADKYEDVRRYVNEMAV